ncbi:disulfide bond formation protein B [Ilumatobacter sp.]|uniref:disulfide bond formation protein B n=1 Tax=Ilumatobacter sp. TaxID=1967498 RepID=UPI003B525EEC
MEPNRVAELFVVALVAGSVAVAVAWTRPSGRRLLARWATAAAAAVAVAATLGSLWFSESAGFRPCELCWYQRIAMYPLAVVLTIAAVRRDRQVFVYALPLALGGALASAYHVREQLFPPESGSCDPFNPCTAKWVDAFGLITIPEMAGASFLLVAALGVWTLRHQRAR